MTPEQIEQINDRIDAVKDLRLLQLAQEIETLKLEIAKLKQQQPATVHHHYHGAQQVAGIVPGTPLGNFLT